MRKNKGGKISVTKPRAKTSESIVPTIIRKEKTVGATTTESKDTKRSEIMNICRSVKSSTEPQFQCGFKASNGEKYCPLHLTYNKIIDYENKIYEIKSDRVVVEKKINPIYLTHEISPKAQVEVPECAMVTTNCKPPMKGKSVGKKAPVKKGSCLKEQTTSSVMASYHDNENTLEVKMLIMINDDEISEKLSDLLGPAFDDITLSEDQEDPITMDKFWDIRAGRKVPLFDNKYYLFSYHDSKGKIRCLTVFTLYDMIESKDYDHPSTTEPMEPDVIARAEKLIELYTTKLNLFNQNSINKNSPEYELKNRINKLFKQFHVHSIYFEDSWLLNVTRSDELSRIVRDTQNLANNNVRNINPNIRALTFPRSDAIMPKVTKGNKSALTVDTLSLQNHVVDTWEYIIKAANSSGNQVPIWIIALGLNGVVPAVGEKYPGLSEMLR